jgi:hypothetical protein
MFVRAIEFTYFCGTSIRDFRRTGSYTVNKENKYISHCRTVPAFNRKFAEICKFDSPNKHINGSSWLNSGTSIKSTNK